jgi:hypothetical protein
MATRFFPRALASFRGRCSRLSGPGYGAGLAVKLILPAVFLALAILPVESLDRLPALCVYRTLFGIRCPGCGMTHAFCAVLHGDFAAALAYNPLVVVAFPFFAFVAARQFAAVLRHFSPFARRSESEPAAV